MTKKGWAITLIMIPLISFALTTGCHKAKETVTEATDKAAETAGAITEKTNAAKEKAIEVTEDVTDKAADIAGAITEKANAAKEKAKEITEDITDKAADTAGAIKDKTTSAASELTDKAVGVVGVSKEAAGNAQETAKENIKMAVPSGNDYVGVKKCKACHFKQYKSWDQTKMASSFENLKPGVNGEAKKKAGLDPGKDYTRDASCVRCHTTGYGKGGFVSLEQTPDLINVQCESCHGPGSEYRVIMKENKEFKLAEVIQAGLLLPSEKSNNCLECHGSDSPFNENLDPKYAFNIKERLKNTHDHFPLKYKH